MVERLEHIQTNAFEIIHEVVQQFGYASFEVVLQIILERYHVSEWQWLGVGPIEHVPVLSYLLNIGRKVSSFLATYFAVHSVVTLSDLNHATADFLNIFQFPTVLRLRHQFQKKLQLEKDPNEISLDGGRSEEEEEARVITAAAAPALLFEEFGLGSLLHHPIIKQYIPPIHRFSIQQYAPLPNRIKVMEILKDYIAEKESTVSSLVSSTFSQLERSFNVAEFQNFLLSRWNNEPSSLLDLGIVLVPEKFEKEFQSLIFEFKRLGRQSMLSTNQFLREEEMKGSSKLPSLQRKQEAANNGKGKESSSCQSVRVRLSASEGKLNPSISQVIESCERFCSNSPYSLTYSKIANFATQFFQSDNNNPHITSSLKKTAEQKIKHGKKRKIHGLGLVETNLKNLSTAAEEQTVNSDLAQIDRQKLTGLLEILKEYLFLMFGKSSKIRSKFDLTIFEQDDAEPARSEIKAIKLVNTEPSETKEEQSNVWRKGSGNDHDGVNNEQQITTTSSANGCSMREYHLTFTPPDLSNYASAVELLENIDTNQIQSVFSFEAFTALRAAATNLYRQRRPLTGTHEHLHEPPHSIGEVGFWGEYFVYCYLQRVLPLTCHSIRSTSQYFIEWKNEKEESLAFYDLMIREQQRDSSDQGQRRRRERSYFIEVKCSQWEQKNAFAVSWQEYQFLSQLERSRGEMLKASSALPLSTALLPVYYLFRVINAFDWNKIRIVVLKDVPKLLSIGRVQLCIAL